MNRVTVLAALAGAALLVAGVVLQWGVSWGLMVAGVLTIVAAVLLYDTDSGRVVDVDRVRAVQAGKPSK